MIYVIFSIVAFAIFLLYRTIYIRRKYRQNFHESSSVALEQEQINRFSAAVTYKTVSHNDISDFDVSQFSAFVQFLKDSFPQVFSNLEVHILSDFAIVLTWRNDNNDRDPVLLYAHYDVVDAYEKSWIYPPFSGTVSENRIWGRGTLDTKNTVMAIFESIESLLLESFTPERTVYFAFGGDEETTGALGATVIRDYFKEKKISFDWILDEGSAVVDGIKSILSQPIAAIGISEKGYMNVSVESNGESGHASMPPVIHSVDRFIKALYKIKNRRQSLKMLPEVKSFFKLLSPYTSFPFAIVFSNLWLFESMMTLLLKKDDTIRALMQTTSVVTKIDVGEKNNVLPAYSKANINVRILPGETRKTVLENFITIVNDPYVQIKNSCEIESFDPVSASEIDSKGYKLIEEAIKRSGPINIVVPLLCNVTTDSKFFSLMSKNIYRFSPMILSSEDRETIHSDNESISFENYSFGIQFYRYVIRSL